MEDFGRAPSVLIFLSVASAASAQLSVPAGGTFALNGGSLDLAGAGLQVSGMLSLAGGKLLDAASILIGAGGTLDAGSGQVTLSGDWSNVGSFVAGSSRVDFVDGAASSQLSGNTSFANLSFVSTTGKNCLFAAGSTQMVGGEPPFAVHGKKRLALA